MLKVVIYEDGEVKEKIEGESVVAAAKGNAPCRTFRSGIQEDILVLTTTLFGLLMNDIVKHLRGE